MSNLVDETHFYKQAEKGRTKRFLDLSLNQLCFLWCVYKHPKVTPLDLRQHLGEVLGESPQISPINTTLEYLRGKGFLTREPYLGPRIQKGRNPYLYSLTPEGETAILDGEWALKQVRGFSV